MRTTVTPEDVLRFWLEEIPAKNWYKSTPELDHTTRERFADIWEVAREAGRAPWREDAAGMLASVILLDQFPRNMFRDDPRAFATDALAVDTARATLAAGYHLEIKPPELRFVFMPFCHSEDLAVQDEGIAEGQKAMPEGDLVLHLKAHREVIAAYGRFPFRNKVLGRETTAEEERFLEEGGYGAVVRRLQQEGAA